MLSGQLLSGQFSTAAPAPQSDVAEDPGALQPIRPLAEGPVDPRVRRAAQEHGRPQDQQSDVQASASEAQAPHSCAQGASAFETAADEMIGAVTSGLMGRVAVIGARPGADTAPIAVLLARTLAGKGKVVLLDLAFGGPGLSALGGRSGRAGHQ